MLRDEINRLVNNSFVEHKQAQRSVRVHIKDENGDFNLWKDFKYGWINSAWHLLENDLEGYEAVILEWLVNVYDKHRRQGWISQS